MEIVALGSRLALLSLFTSCLLLPSIQAREIKYCNKKANYVVKVHDVVISPDPVKTGEDTTFTIKASTSQALTGGKLALDVSYFGIKVHSETHNICEKTSCPISVGKFVLSHTQTLPGITPPGSYTLKMKIEDEKNHQLTCASFGFQIALGSYMSAM
ncbi:Phosphatidylglycerol/phosphatidylinositol transfer protein [Actinidia chinensis var. chinensis]|uniref:Phosphatidylglycerol/phosphatidylinositol transfer protein n=1 Tax=Actinidia chinensis var. chinensis TaxID=1590841 RepID=A0A2R6P704_ACTCC|nr:Phosphatidylglycerol/phosphatidylinositol transfer protein [Actinidia chinensis var. chinensis]